MRFIFLFLFDLFGWKIIGSKPDLKKYMIIVAPHTSNMDFFVGVAARSISRIRSAYLAKKSLFNIPLVGRLLRAMGGYPVDRSKRTNMVDQVVELYNGHEKFVMTITPEGTRSYNANWKTGFYRIAYNARVPIVMVAFDYERKIVQFREPFYPTGNLENDLEFIKAYYRNFKGKNPENGVR